MASKNRLPIKEYTRERGCDEDADLKEVRNLLRKCKAMLDKRQSSALAQYFVNMAIIEIETVNGRN